MTPETVEETPEGGLSIRALFGCIRRCGDLVTEGHPDDDDLWVPLQDAEAAVKKASVLPWKSIGELGEIAYMEDGSHRWKLWAGYEETRLFLVYLASGDIETHFASIDDGGMLCNEHGDDVGWAWYDAEYFMDIPPRPSLPNDKTQAPT
jgi:hypothetical protein